MMDYLDIALWVIAIVHIVTAGYYDLFKDDDIKVIKNAFIAVAMIVFYIGSQF